MFRPDISGPALRLRALALAVLGFFSRYRGPSGATISRQASISGQNRRHEVQWRCGIAECLPGTEDFRIHAFATTEGPRPAPVQGPRRRSAASEWQSLFHEPRHDGHMARTQPEPKKENGQGPTASSDWRVNEGHDCDLGRLRTANG